MDDGTHIHQRSLELVPAVRSDVLGTPRRGALRHDVSQSLVLASTPIRTTSTGSPRPSPLLGSPPSIRALTESICGPLSQFDAFGARTCSTQSHEPRMQGLP